MFRVSVLLACLASAAAFVPGAFTPGLKARASSRGEWCMLSQLRNPKSYPCENSVCGCFCLVVEILRADMRGICFFFFRKAVSGRAIPVSWKMEANLRGLACRGIFSPGITLGQDSETLLEADHNPN